MEDPTPDPIELSIISLQGRLDRLMNEEGLSVVEAVQRLLQSENAQEYVARNERAMDEVTKRLSDPAYMDAYAAAMSEPDERVRAQRLADLKRETFRLVDIEAVHRTIGARNRQWKAEGILSPDAPVG